MADRTHAQAGSRTVEGASRENPKGVPLQYYIPLNVAFYLCLLSNALASALSSIQDCDEVFNYWEPTHYLDHGYGLQTWEYSPEYSIRSWLYVAFHTCISKASRIFVLNKSAQFYFVRLILGLICAACEIRLYAVVSRTLNPRIGVLLLIIMLFSPGMFHASTALLPSSFTMYTSMLGLAAFVDWRSGVSTARGIMWFGVGAIVGWPFSGALMLPFLLEEVVVAVISKGKLPLVYRFFSGGLRCLFVLGVEVAVDSFFYRKLVVVPWNIVAYNVFGGTGKGPDIFGTEPWTFYFRNLLLNFNVWFMLAFSVAPLLVLQAAFRSHATSKQTLVRSITYVLPFYMWFAIFTIQPHKEERFMYPAYPFLAFNAAIAFHIILSYIGSSNPAELMGRISPKLKFAIAILSVLVSINVGLLRTVGMVTAYNAPLQVMKPLEKMDLSNHGNSVCFGKEWYRFPSSYFLPGDLRAKFVKSEFSGLLPGEFSEAPDDNAWRSGTFAIPSGMNDKNQEDLEKYTDISQCAFLVDSYFPGDKESELQPHYALDNSTWKEISCEPFLDSGRTGLLGRVIWIPDLPIVPRRFQRKWGKYCLFEQSNIGSGI